MGWLMIRRITGGAARLAALEIRLVGVMVAASVVSPVPCLSRLPWPPSCLPSHFLALRRFTIRTAGDWSIGLLLLLLPVALWATALPEVPQPPVHRLLMGVLL